MTIACTSRRSTGYGHKTALRRAAKLAEQTQDRRQPHRRRRAGLAARRSGWPSLVMAGMLEQMPPEPVPVIGARAARAQVLVAARLERQAVIGRAYLTTVIEEK